MENGPLEKFDCPISYSALGEALGLSRQTVWGWFRPGRRIPAERVADVEKATGVHRSRLRPDIFGKETAA